ncbi:MAG: hypothetical protein ABIS45_05980 [Burkholderiales bacterium]
MSCFIILGYPKRNSIRAVLTVTGTLTSSTRLNLTKDLQTLAGNYGLKFKQVTALATAKSKGKAKK